MSLEIVIDMPEPAWAEMLPGVEVLASDTLHHAFASVSSGLDATSGTIEIGVTLADDAHLRRLNREYRGKDKPTNVLSFPLWNGLPHPGAIPLLLGDIVISLQTVRRESEDSGRPVRDHLRHMLVHGLLHLLGHDHEVDSEAETMEGLERNILFGIGIPDPYLVPSEVF